MRRGQEAKRWSRLSAGAAGAGGVVYPPMSADARPAGIFVIAVLLKLLLEVRPRPETDEASLSSSWSSSINHEEEDGGAEVCVSTTIAIDCERRRRHAAVAWGKIFGQRHPNPTPIPGDANNNNNGGERRLNLARAESRPEQQQQQQLVLLLFRTSARQAAVACWNGRKGVAAVGRSSGA
jgi:hypothetical protein